MARMGNGHAMQAGRQQSGGVAARVAGQSHSLTGSDSASESGWEPGREGRPYGAVAQITTTTPHAAARQTSRPTRPALVEPLPSAKPPAPQPSPVGRYGAPR